MIQKLGIFAAVAIAALAFFVWATWPGVPLGIAASRSERPPDILMGYDWPTNPTSAQFSQRFKEGTREELIRQWLKDNNFTLSSDSPSASRRYEGVPCAYEFDVEWSAEDGVLTRSGAAKLTSLTCL